MEDIDHVADGSNKHQVTLGFFLLGAVALDLVGEITAHCQGRGFLPHCVIDRGGDRGRLFDPFLSKNIPFTIRLNKKTLIDVDTQEVVSIPQKALARWAVEEFFRQRRSYVSSMALSS